MSKEKMERDAYIIRPARFADLDFMAGIELDAFVTLRKALGVEDDGRTVPRDKLQRSLDAGLLFAAVDDLDQPFAFLAAAELDGAIYVVEIDVMQRWQRKGIGRRLMQTVIETAQMRSASGVTLTTDRYVPFNAPFYASLGFQTLDERQVPAGLFEILKFEIDHGADPERRVAMALWF
ncbi:GNAT family N-acetyltransferase [Rhizobium calliandrae]|uniref:GNAT family N-acetyltransferase n=1 Tax=Rhizobium calliandrae TaxID=1312182 RepID=A0ABT7K738_9HYPH|nr:GNAT family N-acetyltransferase [Rhizobium calliandrae]MDL2404413.1 GNAT family N-acetyltransferase [Rhizobium calliandrae]